MGRVIGGVGGVRWTIKRVEAGVVVQVVISPDVVIVVIVVILLLES